MLPSWWPAPAAAAAATGPLAAACDCSLADCGDIAETSGGITDTSPSWPIMVLLRSTPLPRSTGTPCCCWSSWLGHEDMGSGTLPGAPMPMKLPSIMAGAAGGCMPCLLGCMPCHARDVMPPGPGGPAICCCGSHAAKSECGARGPPAGESDGCGMASGWLGGCVLMKMLPRIKPFWSLGIGFWFGSLDMAIPGGNMLRCCWSPCIPCCCGDPICPGTAAAAAAAAAASFG
mmetsp:Transcript_19489/g.47132  ORF Transcript_19489/g.47132 Transcript_19489/m.47132 type:complete len:231 (+) Transcript_19489:761-1453(+)